MMSHLLGQMVDDLVARIEAIPDEGVRLRFVNWLEEHTGEALIKLDERMRDCLAGWLGNFSLLDSILQRESILDEIDRSLAAHAWYRRAHWIASGESEKSP
jgi:hypothetical protein